MRIRSSFLGAFFKHSPSRPNSVKTLWRRTNPTTQLKLLHASVRIAVSAFLALFFLCGFARADNYYVNASTGSNSSGNGTQSTPWKTITYALGQISGPTTLYVSAGTYNTALGETFPIVVKSGVSLVGGGIDVSIIDANSTNIVLRCNGIVDATTRVEGFTIKGGKVSTTTSSGGAGIFISAGSALTITNNKITGNTNYSFGLGGGIYIWKSAPLIVDNIISGNSPGTSGDGAGIYVSDGSPLIKGNRIESNTSYGSGIYVTGSLSSPRILNNVIAKNKEGGIECTGSSKPKIINNTISDNTSHGISINTASPDSIINNIISLNSGYGISESGTTSDPGKVWYNLFYSNGSGVYRDEGSTDYYTASSVNAAVPETKNSLDGDPLFANKVGGDYHVRSGSPAIDAGDPTFDYSAEPSPNGGRIEIGAYGNTATAAQSGGSGLPTLTDYYVNASTGNNSTGTGTQSAPWKTITYALGQISGSGRTLHVASGTYNTTLGETFPIVVKNGVSLVGAGMDVSIIDAGSTDIVLRCAGVVDATTRVDGFTVKGGIVTTTTSTGGAGIYISGGSALTITNNKITGNTNCSFGLGGGIYISSSTPSILNNVITGNSPGVFGHGAGIYVSDASPLIKGNRIESNTGYGCGVYVDGASSSPRILNNIIAKNMEGGIECVGSSKARIINNTISDNTLDAIIISYASPDSIINNIVSFNSGYGISEEGTTSDPGKVWYNLFYSNGLGVYRDEGTTDYYTSSMINSGVAECKNNLDGDPMFVDRVNGDYHERSGSPAIDAGDPTFDYGSEPTPNGGRINVGAYGNTTDATKSGSGGLPSLTDYYVNSGTGSNTTGNGSQATPWKTITYALNQITGTGHILYVLAGTYNTALGETFPIVVKSGVSLVGGGIDVSIIDANSTNIVLRCNGIVDATTRVEGFTIKGGKVSTTTSSGGAGIFISAGSALTITNNKITGNTNYSFGLGGGIYISSSTPSILNNVITGNSPGTFGEGAGIYVSNGSPLIKGNRVESNTGYGSGIYVTGSSSSPRILNNVIAKNKEGGIGCSTSSKPKIINNTISDNTSDGIFIGPASPDSIINNIISLNSGYGINESGTTSDPGKVWYNLFYSNGSGVYRDEGSTDYYTSSSVNAAVPETKNNLDGDPMFVVGDYQLRSGSPAINAGDPGSPLDPDGTRADIGAYYYAMAVSVPTAPSLSSPSNVAVSQPTTVALSWNASASATKYHLQVSTTSAFGSLVVNDSSLTIETSRLVGPLANGTPYYWHVRAGNSAGWSSYSGSWSFTTVAAPPSAPVLALPSDGSTGVPTNPTLSWNASDGATSYQLQVSANLNFSSFVVNQSGITGTSYSASGLANNTVYYWHVNATNAGSTSSYSSTWSFTTTAAASQDYYVDAKTGSNTAGGGTSSSPWKTITYALSQISGSGNTVRIAGGTYDTNLGEAFPILLKDGVSLIGAGSDVAIVDAKGTNTVIKAVSITDPATVVKGFTFQGGGNTNQGGGLSITAGSAFRLQGCRITSNIVSTATAAKRYGGGIYVLNSSPTIVNCEISGNTVMATRAPTDPSDFGAYGAGVAIVGSSSPQLLQNIIRDNEAQNSFFALAYGAGVYVAGSATPLLEGNTISRNTLRRLYATSGTTLGAGISIENSGGVFTGNTIASNGITADYGSLTTSSGIYIAGSSSKPKILRNVVVNNTDHGIWCELSATPTIVNNTIVENTGDGIYLSGTAPDSIVNNIVALNSNYGINESSTSSDPGKVWYNLFYANSAGLYRDEASTDYYSASTLNGGVSECKNNLEGDPLFVDRANGDYRLRSGSPAINAGDPGTPLDPDGTRADIGALYYVPIASVPSAPSLSSPSNGATAQPTTLTLTWAASAGATQYHLQLSTTSAFTTFVVNDSSLTGTSKSVGLLSNGTTYYWRVRAGSSAGWSAFSGNWSFTTAASALAWAAQSSGVSVTLFSVKAVNGNVAWACGAKGTILRTMDRGTTWTQVSPLVSSVNCYNIEAADANTAWVVADDPNSIVSVLYKTTNGGSTWTQQLTSSDPTTSYDAVRFYDANNGILIGDPEGGYFVIYTTTDGGSSWSRTASVSIPTPAAGEYGLANNLSISGDNAWFSTVNNSGGNPRIFRSTDRGKTWQVSIGTSGLGNELSTIAFASETVGLVQGINGNIIRTTDGGVSWGSMIITGASVGGSVDFATPTAAVFLGSGGQSGLSLDAGLTWFARSTPDTTTMCHISFSSSTDGWAVGNRGTIWRWVGGVLAGPPWVTTSATTNIDPTSATLHAVVTPNANATNAQFEWGTTTAVLNTTAVQAVGAGSNPMPISATLPGLTPNTTYFVRAMAQNSSGTTKGSITSFTTLPLAGDPYEPNNTSANATPIAYNFKSSGAEIGPAGDVDYYKFSATTGDFASIEVVTDPNGFLDVRVSLYDPAGTELAYSDIVSAGTERILFGIDKTQTYYIRVVDAADVGSFPNAVRPTSFRKGQSPAKVGASSQTKGSILQTGPYTLTLTPGAPLPPQDLTAGTGFDGIVPLQWIRPQSNTTSGYRIYRSTSSTGPFSQVGATDGEDFVDLTAANGVPYYYAVKSVYAATNAESPASNIVRATPRANGYKVTSKFALIGPTLDGKIRSGEWVDAQVQDITVKRTLNPSSSVTMYLKNDDQTLYIAVEDSNARQSMYNFLIIAFDRDLNKTWDQSAPSNEGFITIDDSAGVPIVLFYGVTGDYPDVHVDDGIRDPKGVTAKFSYEPKSLHYEVALDLSRAAPAASGLDAMGLYVAVVSNDSLNGESPPGALRLAPTTFAEVTLSKATVAAPAIPNLASPANGVTNQPLSLTLSWNAVAGATSYRLQLDKSNAFATPVVDDSSITTTSRPVSSLTNGTTYYWRVSAKNAGGSSPFSATYSFVTVVGIPNAPTLSAPSNNAPGVSSTVTLTWSSVTGATTYHVQVSTNSGYSAPLVLEDSSVVSNSRQLSGLAANATYYWRVRAKNAGGNSAWPSSFMFSTAATRAVTSPGVSFPSNPTASTDYRLVSFPGTLTLGVGQVLSGAQNTDWRMFKDNGATEPNNLTELSSSSSLSPGEGYWLVTKGTFNFSNTLMMPQLSPDGSYTISVRNDWNIIGNPFDVPVAWQTIKTDNAPLTANLWTYGTSGFQTSTTLEAFKGYYFFSSSTSLKIRYPFAAKIEPIPPPVIDWKLQLALETEGNVDLENYVGIAPSAGQELDDLNQPKPPPAFDQAFLSLAPPAGDGREKRFSSDFRPRMGGGQTWTFEVSNPKLSKGRIHIVGLEKLPSSYEVILIDEHNTVPIDLRRTDQLPLRTTKERMRFNLIVGDKSFVRAQEAKYIPEDFELSQNYPNPFNPSTSITYKVPRESFVKLEILSVLGQHIATLAEANHAPGTYTVVWNAGDQTESHTSSGVYFSRLVVDGKVFQTKKMTLLK